MTALPKRPQCPLYRDLQVSLQTSRRLSQLVQARSAAVGRLLASITQDQQPQTIKNCLYLTQVETKPSSPSSSIPRWRLPN
jgi:hypothetical protein